MPDDGRRYGTPFACAPGMRLEAHERLAALQFAQLTTTIAKLEAVVDRLEKRLWLAVYGVLAVVLSEAVQSVVQMTP